MEEFLDRISYNKIIKKKWEILFLIKMSVEVMDVSFKFI